MAKAEPKPTFLPGTDRPLHCFFCGYTLNATQLGTDNNNPFDTPIAGDGREQYVAFSWLCDFCGATGNFQYRDRRITMQGEEGEQP